MARRSFIAGIMRVALVLAIVAVGLRVAVPDGMMVGAERHGLEITVCTGHGPLELTVDATGKALTDTKDKAPHEKSQSSCPFALAATGMTAADGATLPAPGSVIYSKIAPTGVYATPNLGLAAPPPHTTGPPSII